MNVLETINTSELEARVMEATEILSGAVHTGVHGPAVRLDHATFVATIRSVATEVAGGADPDEAKCLAELGRHALGTQARGEAAGLEDEDLPRLGEAGFEESGGNAGRLPGAGGSVQDRRAIADQSLRKPGKDGLDREAGHYRSAPTGRRFVFPLQRTKDSSGGQAEGGGPASQPTWPSAGASQICSSWSMQ